jgi:hypothetical protein
MNAPRYQGKPLLRLLECYVRKTIEELSVTDAANLMEMQPKLGQIYGFGGTWNEIIASALELPENMPTLIRDSWKKNQAIALANGVTLSAQQFAEMFVDQNLAQ